MLPELQPRADKILGRFRMTDSQLGMLISLASTEKPFTGRKRTEAVLRATDILTRAHSDVLAPGAALVKLNYVRSARQVRPEFRLEPQHEDIVAVLTKDLQRGIADATQSAHKDIARRLRQIYTAGNVPRYGAVVTYRGQTWSLEQYVRVVLRNVSNRAVTLGRLAASGTNGYRVGA